jgi:hypothetical protein
MGLLGIEKDIVGPYHLTNAVSGFTSDKVSLDSC